MSEYVPTVEERQEEIERPLEPSQTDSNYDDMLAMLKECKAFIGGVAIADERGDQWRWELYPRLKDLLLRLNSGG